jgi:hypothetical protein
MTKSYWASRYNGARRVVAAGSLDMTPVPSPVLQPQSPQSPHPTAPDDDDPIAAFANR